VYHGSGTLLAEPRFALSLCRGYEELKPARPIVFNIVQDVKECPSTAKYMMDEAEQVRVGRPKR
jgi:hypothetical protein